MKFERCHCGRQLHYANPIVERIIGRIVAEKGEFMNVTAGGRTFRVQRHFIALHGLKAVELPSLGFEEVRT